MAGRICVFGLRREKLCAIPEEVRSQIGLRFAGGEPQTPPGLPRQFNPLAKSLELNSELRRGQSPFGRLRRSSWFASILAMVPGETGQRLYGFCSNSEGRKAYVGQSKYMILFTHLMVPDGSGEQVFFPFRRPASA